MFAKSFVINLPFKTDRLEKFTAAYPSCLTPFTVHPAVHGDSIRHPDWWQAGAGAWGCYRSHMQILERCYQEQVESYIVFEDDAIFRPDFEQEFAAFSSELPAEWEMVYLGGQLLHEHANPPRKISNHVYVPYNVNRTHCFAVHQRGYVKLYKHLNATPFAQHEHIDHHVGRLHESGQLKIYVPGRWLVGQDAGSSNISGKHNAANFWPDPEKLANNSKTWKERFIPAIYLEAPISVSIELERRGWHRGHWQNSEHLDRGVCMALESSNVKEGLNGWYRAVMGKRRRKELGAVAMPESKRSQITSPPTETLNGITE